MKNSMKHNPEKMRAEAFLPDGKNTVGCYSTFIVSKKYKHLTPKSKKFKKAIDLLIFRDANTKRIYNLLAGEEYDAYKEEYQEIARSDSVYYNKKDDILMAWFWDGDGTLIFWRDKTLYYNTDCKKVHHWETSVKNKSKNKSKNKPPY